VAAVRQVDVKVLVGREASSSRRIGPTPSGGSLLCHVASSCGLPNHSPSRALASVNRNARDLVDIHPIAGLAAAPDTASAMPSERPVPVPPPSDPNSPA
jgi:hypothetical protein